MQYIASNEDSWKAARDNEKVARPFAIYCDDKMIGFTMFAFDEDYEDPNDRYWLWRFMIDERLQGKGYGTAALQVIIRYFKDHVRVLHLHDNNGESDQHLIPGQGTIPWGEVFKALKEIGYSGDFTLEADAFLKDYSNENVLDGVIKLRESATELARRFEKL